MSVASTSESGRHPGRGRGRVVMLVDNAVNGDSRVQKAARSMADAGWDVVLLGQSPDRDRHRWTIGAAEVRLVPVVMTLAKRRRDYRRVVIPRLFAYRRGGIAQHRRQWVKAWRADLLARRSAEGRRFLVRRTAARILARWVGFRHRQLALVEGRRNPDSLPERLRTAMWRALLGDRCWRRLEPYLWDYEFAFGPVVDALEPDLIHANDFRMIGVGARAVHRARGRGRSVRLVWDAHEYLPGIKPRAGYRRWMPAHVAHEREYGRCADAVVTVSQSLAELLHKEHRLPRLPAVVLNAPGGGPPADRAGEPVPDLRELCGIDAGTPLLVYSGALAPQRGLATLIEALPQLPGAHAALVVPAPDGWVVRKVLDHAADLGVADRVHPLPYVPHWQIVPFLASADIGVIPIHHWPNHELALITKFMEYAHARLPIVVSDVRTMAAEVRETGQGEVFRAEDTADFVRAARAVLDDPAAYRKAYDRPGLLERWTWETQADILDGLYGRLLATPAEATAVAVVPQEDTEERDETEPGDPAGATAT
ncbi:glycosyltransferase family 4 protein [Streptomyces sp. NBC_01725]|uniref:glycosyltransferase family 4 protein n=1 Tax=Streptomyces sp. NBC_01725 TaxID=2975923 RepID=UPI002E299D72|nr:glycosyltransferase family 4 protein [Streptomyces sp. NBC_01725]